MRGSSRTPVGAPGAKLTEAPVLAPVLVIVFEAAKGEPALAALRRRHPGARLIVLTTAASARRLGPLADEVWPDGLPRGPARLLALMRRIAWARVAHVYALEAGLPLRLMRLCVWPRPQWHRLDTLAAEPGPDLPLS